MTFIINNPGEGGSPSSPVLVPSLTQVEMFDDFVAFLTSSNYGWGTSGFSVNTTAVSDPAHPGILRGLKSSIGVVYLALSSRTFEFGGGAINEKWLVYIPTLSDGVNQMDFYIGFGNSFSAGFSDADGVQFQYDLTTHGANWQTATKDAAGSTINDSGVAVAAATWTMLEIDINAAGTEAVFKINDTVVDTITTNVPTRSLAPMLRGDKVLGAGGLQIYVDAFGLSQTLTNPRY